MRVVALPADRVDADEVADADADGVVDEAGDDVVAEDLAGQPVAEVLTRPRPVVLVHVVDAFEEVRDPANAALGESELDGGELPQHGREEEVGGGLDAVD